MRFKNIRYSLLIGFSVQYSVEILEDLPNVDAVFVSVGGGGLIVGIAAYLKSVKPSVKVKLVKHINRTSANGTPPQ